jgi:predicted amidohydrolase YtcJ
LRDLLLYNARVLTQGTPATATAVAIRDGRIAAAGDSDELSRAANGRTPRIDLGGRTLIPGFNDAHAHVWKIGHLLTSMLDLRRATSVAAIVDEVRGACDRLPASSWVLGRGFNEAALAERRMVTRHDLDRASLDRPIALTRTCGHIYAVNSAALARASITRDTPAPDGGAIERDESGAPNGLLHETAMGLVNRVLPSPSAADYQAMIDAALRHQLSLGITSTADCGVSPALLSAYRSLDAGGSLRARVNVMPLRKLDGDARPVALPDQTVSEMLRVDTVKFLADGGLSGATAALSVNYRHAPHHGVLRFDAAELRELCRESHDAGWRIATHAIGDVAIEQVLGIYAGLGPHPRGIAHRIEHFGVPTADQVARAAALRVIAAPQTIFLRALGRNFRGCLPDGFLPRTYPIRAMLDAGVRVALSSDAPVVEDDNPLAGIEAAVTRRDGDGQPIAPEQAITIAEALRAYTLGGAVASGDEMNRGTIEPGKWADLAVLSADPTTTDPDALSTIRVDMTLLAGRVVFER